MNIEPEIIVGLLALVGTLVGSFAGIMTANKLTNYRVQQLEKKVEKHNSVIERTALLEKDLKVVWHNISEIKEEIREVEK